MHQNLKIEIKQLKYASNEYKQLINLRNEVLRKPLNMVISAEDLANDKNSILFGGFLNDEMIACFMLIQKDENTMQLRQMAVLENMQGKGIGKQFVQFAEQYSRKINCNKIILHARLHKKGFYEKLGYKSYSDIFLEVGIKHIAMQKSI